ncbi:MAG: adenylate kinase family protein [archaeon]|nr:adenylate kinase family protein [archaeon]
MLVAITGTPGVGKSTVSKLLSNKYNVIDINSYAKKNGLLEEFDTKLETYNVDVNKLSDSLKFKTKKSEIIFLDGHLSHFVSCDFIIVLRCDPNIIYERLKKRGYSTQKIQENVQAEILDVILCESMKSGITTSEINCTNLTPSEIVKIIEETIKNPNLFAPGCVDWSHEIDKWF